MKYDILKSGIENVLALINADNAQSFTLEQISVSVPSAYVDETGVNPRNTQIVITALPGSGFVDSQTHRFTRIDLAGQSVEPVVVQLGESSTLEDVKAQVVAQLLVADSEVQLSVSELPAFNGVDEEVVQLVAVDGSYGYIGQIDVIVKKFIPEPIPMSEASPNQDLNGFEA